MDGVSLAINQSMYPMNLTKGSLHVIQGINKRAYMDKMTRTPEICFSIIPLKATWLIAVMETIGPKITMS